METRREFFRKIKSVVVGAGAVAAGLAAIPPKKTAGELIDDGFNFGWKGFIPAKDQTFRGIPIIREYACGPDRIVCSRPMYDYLQSTGRIKNGRIS